VPAPEWVTWVGTFLGGVVATKVFEKLADFFHEEIKARRSRKLDDADTADRSLEPLLRSCDELAGKLRSLAEKDFIPIHQTQQNPLDDLGFSSLIYLFVQFWSEVEIVRFKGLSTRVARTERGNRTQAFLRCLESRRVRLIDRISQRAIGESALTDARTANFVEFMKMYEQDAHVKRWVQPLIEILSKTREHKVRQSILQYAVVLHAMIDTIDEDHRVTRDRPGLPNKLNIKTRRELHFRVFGVYLKFVKATEKYIGPPI